MSTTSISDPKYPAARAVAGMLRSHFSECVSLAHALGEAVEAPRPEPETIERMIEVAFWASLRRDEGRSPTISLAYLPPDASPDALLLSPPIPLQPERLSRVAPAVERAGIHLGVWHDGRDLYVWGSTRTVPPSCFVVETVQPGLLVVKRRRPAEHGKYANVAVLDADEIKLVDQAGTDLPEHLPFLASLLAPESFVNVAVQLALSMRAHRHGGTLLVVPHESDGWRGSMIPPIPYQARPMYAELSELLRETPRRKAWSETLQAAVDRIAGLTAVDGATVMTARYDVLAFGARIGRALDGEAVEQVRVLQPVVGSDARVVDATQLGGTRHLSAAQFVRDQQDCFALVASQDGPFTAFVWPAGATMVHAHRLDMLLM